MRLARAGVAAAVAFGTLLLPWAASGASAQEAGSKEVSAAVYTRTDSADTTVIAPRFRATVPIAEGTGLDLVYAVDVWTSASIDIITAASRYPDGTIKPVTEQRDEVSATLVREQGDFTLSGGGRYSTEPDYQARSGSAGLGYDFADNNATLGVGLSLAFDEVGRAGDPGFTRAVDTQGGSFSFTQVLDVNTVAQAVYEVVRVSGYQSSPYRYVAIGGGTCTRTSGPTGQNGAPIGDPLSPAPAPTPPATAGLSPLCLPEHNPELRHRHAIGLLGRRALGSDWSLGSGYRYYFDDWGLTSHTIRMEASWVAGDATLLSARYRFYTQGAADHYQPQYDALPQHATRDKELSPMSSHRIALEVEQSVTFESSDTVLDMTLSGAPVFYSYTDFPAVQSITAFDANLTLVLRL